MNIKFSYLYRDYSNYKQFNEVIFENPTGVSLEAVAAIIKEHLTDGEWFYASEWKVPDLHFEGWDPEDDHFFHEFESVEETIQPPTSTMSIDQFLTTIKKAKKTFL